MNYWWVNQNQTHRHEIAGEYMWSPKFSKNNRRNPYYDNMVKVSPGDLVYSFIDTKIQYIGIIQSRGFSYLKPGEFGSEGDTWDDEGWKVRVIYCPLENIIRPKDHIDQLRPFLPDKYSPLQKDSGNGPQNSLSLISSQYSSLAKFAFPGNFPSICSFDRTYLSRRLFVFHP